MIDEKDFEDVKNSLKVVIDKVEYLLGKEHLRYSQEESIKQISLREWENIKRRDKMKLSILLLLLVTIPCAAMQKKAAPISKSAQKYATTKASCDKAQAEKSVTRKPYTEEDKPWYLRILEQKAQQYGQVQHGSRDHYLHEGEDEN